MCFNIDDTAERGYIEELYLNFRLHFDGADPGNKLFTPYQRFLHIS
jgi:hypothetical protein